MDFKYLQRVDGRFRRYPADLLLYLPGLALRQIASDRLASPFALHLPDCAPEPTDKGTIVINLTPLILSEIRALEFILGRKRDGAVLLYNILRLGRVCRDNFTIDMTVTLTLKAGNLGVYFLKCVVHVSPGGRVMV
jgi:hypothetical protein